MLFPHCFQKPLLPVSKTWVCRGQGLNLRPAAHNSDALTPWSPQQLKISEDVIYWINMVVWKPFTQQQNFSLVKIKRVCRGHINSL